MQNPNQHLKKNLGNNDQQVPDRTSQESFQVFLFTENCDSLTGHYDPRDHWRQPVTNAGPV